MTQPLQPPVPAPKSVFGRSLLAETLIVLALFAGSGAWATWFWSEWTARGWQGAFYQTYFEPAVMVACGKGFVISSPQPKPLEDFLFQRRDSLRCDEIPADTVLGTRYLYQGAWRYLLVAVGIGWRLLGISWTAIGPIAGFAFGTVIAFAYGIFRLGMGRILASAVAVCLAVSSMHLLNMPHLRDYAKAPFTLALVFLLGLIVTLPVRRWRVVGLAIGCGVVLGVGYGFRTDFLINVPVVVLALFAFLGGGLWRNLGLKVASAALFVATFMVVSWPITSTVYTAGGCQWHVTLLGLQSPFDDYLRVAPAPYDFGYAYSDSYIDRTVNGYRWRAEPSAPPLVFCSHEYDVQSGRYLQALATTFPADLIARSYASVLQIVELPFQRFTPPIEGWLSPFYAARAWLLQPGHRWGFWFTAVAVLLTGAVSVRLSLFLLFFLAYFGGYPAIQFQERHYFHLEFIGWWMIGFVGQRALTAVRSRGQQWPDRATVIRRARQSLACAAAAGIVLGGVLFSARWYQSRQVRTLLAAYIAAPKTLVEAPGAALAGLGPSDYPKLLEVNLDGTACGQQAVLTFRYDKAEVGVDFTRTITVPLRGPGPGTTRVFLPVFEKYIGIELAGVPAGCLTGVYRVDDLRPFPILLGATLPPHWESLPLYQRLADWELD